MKAKKLTELALLTGIALVIFVVELQFPNPFPIPGIKLGLANIVTVYAMYHYRACEIMMVVGVRIFLAAIFGGNMTALLYSFAGSVLCVAGMLFMKRIIDSSHIWLSSVLGAVLHNSGQIAVAVFMMGKGIIGYFPFLIVSGCLAGAFTGFCAQLVTKRFSNKDISKDKM